MKVEWRRIDSFLGNFSTPELTYYRPCPICGSIKNRTIVEIRNFQYYSDSAVNPKRVKFRQNQCWNCYALFLNPCFSNYGFSVLFEEAGMSYGASPKRYDEIDRWMREKGLFDKGGIVLDAGCYEGTLLAKFPSKMKRVGVDIDASVIERGRSRYGNQGIEFIVGDFESFRYSFQPDIITMFHILEHLPRPVEALRYLRRISKSDTNLLIEVPILEKGKTNDINGFFSPQHMTHFSKTSLDNILLTSGWNPLSVNEMPSYNGLRVIARPSTIGGEIKHETGDMGFLCENLSHWYNSIANIEQVLEKTKSSPRMAIWGGGVHTELVYHLTSFFDQNPEREYVIIDSDPAKNGKSWRGIRIFEPSSLPIASFEKCPLLISSYSSQESILKAAKNAGFFEEDIIKLYNSIERY